MGKLGKASASPLHSRSPSPTLRGRNTAATAVGSASGTGREGLGGLLGNNHNSQYHSHYLQYGREYQQAQQQPQYHHHGHGLYQQHSQQGNLGNSPLVSHVQLSVPYPHSQHSYGSLANGTNSNNMTSSHLQPPSSQMPSKRDKRRNALSERLTELSVSFERDKDIHHRSQLAALQQDLSAIARADTSGKDLRMLDDSAEGIDNFVTGGVWLGDGASMSNIRGSGGPVGAMGGVQPGTFYASFVAEVNEKMEERDVALTLLHKQYHAKVTAIQAQHERSLHHAREEHINLAVTMKQRLINRLYNAKKKLSLDKEHLDISDNSALLLHPNQFSIGSAAAGVLGSPSRIDIDRGSDIFGSGTINGSNGTTNGGRRKLRQRRNELDDLMMMGPGGIFDNFGRKDSDNGDAKSAAAQRRKARAARYNRRINGGTGEEEENNMEDIYGNVHTNGGTDGDGNNSGNNSTAGQTQLNTLLHAAQKQPKVQTVGNGNATVVQQMQPQDLLHKQVYSIEKLFTEKELQMAGNLAALATVKYFSKPKERGSRKGRKGDTGEEDGVEGGANEDSDAGARTPREEAEPKVDADNVPAATSFTTAAGDEQMKSHEKDSLGISSPPDLSAIPPATLFSSVIASSANHTRSANPSLAPTHATPLINPSALNSHPPPSLAALNFMTPTSTGYGAPVWQSLGIPATYFSTGNGLIVNSITTTKMMALSAPCPPAAKSEEALEDLELIRSGRGLVEEEEGTGEDGVEEEESRSKELVEARKGRKGREEKEREREIEREKEKEKEKEKEGSPSPPPRGEGKKVVGLGLGLNIDEQDEGGADEIEENEKEKEKEKGSSVPPPLAVSELVHGVKRRASSGPCGAEKRVRKEKDGGKEKEKEKGREKERERAREMVDDAGEEGDAEEES